MDNAHEVLLREVCTHFNAIGEWPKVEPLQIKLRGYGNVALIAAEIGSEVIFRYPSDNGEVFKLTLRGLEQCGGSEPDIQHFLWLVRTLGKRFIEGEMTDQLPLSEVVAELGLSEVELKRLGQLVWDAGICSGLGRQPNGEITLTPSKSIWYFEEVHSLVEFYSSLERVNSDTLLVHQRSFPVQAVAAGTQTSRSVTPFIHSSRIQELTQIRSHAFDLSRLIALCNELNTCAENDCVFAIAMLTRAIIDHVPPIFTVNSFAAVASNYLGTKSFKDSMDHLEKSTSDSGCSLARASAIQGGAAYNDAS